MGYRRSHVSILMVLLLLGLTGCLYTADLEGGGLLPDDEVGQTVINGKLQPAVTLTMVRGEDPTAIFKYGESYADNVHTRWARETLGINLKTLWSSPVADGSYDTKLKLMLSSNEPLPDVFISTQQDITSRYIESGKVLNVSEVFEKYASKTWKEAVGEVPSAWLSFMKDGQKYAIPLIRQTMGTQPVLWIRQDWLDHLKLKAPTTLKELEQVMDAFVNRDPDGNGVKDTVALDFGIKDQLTGNAVGEASWIFGLFGAIPEKWYPGPDGKLQYGSIQPGIKKALSKIKEWKDKAYISEDIALHDFSRVSANVVSGNVGIVAGESWFSDYPGLLATANNPEARYKPYAIPAGEDGKSMRNVGDPYTGAILIKKNISAEALHAFFYYMNTLYDVYNSEDPFYFRAYQNGYDYQIIDGQAVFDDNRIPGGRVSTMKYSLMGFSISYPSRDLNTILKIAKGEKLTNSDLVVGAFYGQIGNEIDKRPDLASSKAVYVAMSQADIDVREYFQGPATPTMRTRNAWLKRMQMDTFIDIIYGEQPLTAFDSFVAKWKASGGNEITQEVNEWYNSVQ